MNVLSNKIDVTYKNFEEILTKIKEKNIKWINLQFTDLFGYLRQLYISSESMFTRLSNNIVGKFDGSSVKGFANVEQSDLFLKPDILTFAEIPWSNSVRFICDVYKETERFLKDPRYIAQKTDNWLADQRLKVFISPELEFFILIKYK